MSSRITTLVKQNATDFDKALADLKNYDKIIDSMTKSEIEKREDEINNRWESFENVCRVLYRQYLVGLGGFTLPFRDLDFVISFCTTDSIIYLHLVPHKMCTRLVITNLHYESGDHLSFFTEPTSVFCGHLKKKGFYGPFSYRWNVLKEQKSVKEAMELFFHYYKLWEESND